MKKTGIAILALLAEEAQCAQIYGGQTISKETIETVLEINGSPAEGISENMCTLSEKYRIDPAFLLAVFGKESDYGTSGIARKTKSWANMRPGHEWKGKIYNAGRKGRFRHYSAYTQSLENFCRHLRLNYPEQTTLEEWAQKHAPAKDKNDTSDFIADMLKKIETYQRIESRQTVPVRHEQRWLFLSGDQWRQLSEGRAYIVKTGDTLGAVCRKFGTTEAKLKSLNGLKGSYLKSGQYLKTR